MFTYKNYIIGALLLSIGILLGWLIKPTEPMDSTHDYSMHEEASSVPSDDAMATEIWTCSMHPQVRQNEYGVCPICEMDLIPLDNSLGTDDPTILQMTEQSAKLAQISTLIVGTGDPGTTSSAIAVEGTIEMDERSINIQTSHVSGRIDKMYVNFTGDYVKTRQKIATIYSTELLAASQELITAAKYDDRVSGLKDASIQKLKNWKITDQQIAEILASGQAIETIDIYADHSGYVLDKLIRQGAYVRQGQSLYTTGQTGRLWLLFNVYESDMKSVRLGQRIEFTTPALGSTVLKARVNYIDPILNVSTRTAVVRADFVNKGNRLKPGMLLTGKIIGTTSSPSRATEVSIPKSAVLWTGDRSVVYVSLPDMNVPSYQYREVVISRRSGKNVFIVEGVKAGEEIVVHGAFAVDAAAQLNNNFSMMNGDVTIKKNQQNDRTPDFTDDTPDEFKQQLNVVANAYIDLKDTFVATDAKAASQMAQKFTSSLMRVDMTLLKGEGHKYWMEQLSALSSHGDKISEISDVESQRKQFGFLSDAMIKSIEAFGTIGNTYYVQYCPMAFGNQGADWISSETAIKNPYFGDKMMKCGSVKRSLGTGI